MLYHLPFVFFLRACSVYRREFHTIKRACNDFCLVFECIILLIQSSLAAHSVASSSLTHPRVCHLHLCFHIVWLHGSAFMPDACVDCHHFVLLHLKTCFKVSTTALGLSSQTHPMARHILSALTSHRNGRPIFTHIFLAVLQALA